MKRQKAKLLLRNKISQMAAQMTTDSLLERVQSLVELERSLTVAMEKAEPWMPGGNSRPLPKTMEEVDHILCIARNLASRTSAPAGWNPQAPVVGFATPNPLPHQLRGGALGALQLELARKSLMSEQEEKKRQKEEAEAAKAKKDKAQAAAAGEVKKAPTSVAPQRQRLRQPVIVADMNLSDSSSEEEESEDDDL